MNTEKKWGWGKAIQLHLFLCIGTFVKANNNRKYLGYTSIKRKTTISDCIVYQNALNFVFNRWLWIFVCIVALPTHPLFNNEIDSSKPQLKQPTTRSKKVSSSFVIVCVLSTNSSRPVGYCWKLFSFSTYFKYILCVLGIFFRSSRHVKINARDLYCTSTWMI